MSSITTALLVFLVVPLISVLAAPALDSQSLKQNGAAAQKLNAQFASLQANDSCQEPDMACVQGAFAQCVGGHWQTTPCAGGTQCVALPLVNKVGTSITCDTQADALSRISNTGVSGGLTGSDSGTGTGTGTNSGTKASASDMVNSTDSVGCGMDMGDNGTNSTDPLPVATNGGNSTTALVPDASNSTDISASGSDVSATPSSTQSLPLPSSAGLPDAVNVPGNGSGGGVFSSFVTTMTLTPASASAALLLGQGGQPTPSSVPSVSASDASSDPISLSLFMTTPTGASPAGPTPSGSAGTGGYGY